MQTTAAEIETIVRLVMERLRTGAATINSVDTVAPADAVTSAGTVNSGDAVDDDSRSTLRLDNQLVTLEQLPPQLLRQTRRVQVSPQAVVTPSVIDELRKHGVELRRASGDSGRHEPSARSQIVVVAPSAKCRILEQQAARLSLATLAADGDCHATAGDIQAQLAGGAGGAVWYSRVPFAAVCAAGPIPGLEAVQIFKLGDLPSAVEQANPNLLIVDEPSWSVAHVLKLIQAWQRSRT